MAVAIGITHVFLSEDFDDAFSSLIQSIAEKIIAGKLPREMACTPTKGFRLAR